MCDKREKKKRKRTMEQTTQHNTHTTIARSTNHISPQKERGEEKRDLLFPWPKKFISLRNEAVPAQHP
jgi:hypothetical protein